MPDLTQLVGGGEAPYDGFINILRGRGLAPSAVALSPLPAATYPILTVNCLYMQIHAKWKRTVHRVYRRLLYARVHSRKLAGFNVKYLGC